jgi:plastocyanin
VPPDAIVLPDAVVSDVVVVSCTRAVATTVTVSDRFVYVFTPTATVRVGDVVRFEMDTLHDAVSGTPTGGPDGAFLVDRGQTVCLQFNAAGRYPFFCRPHRFTGTLSVAEVQTSRP